MTPWKYFVERSLFERSSRLYRSLDEVLVDISTWDTIGLVPSGHAPWRSSWVDGKTSPLASHIAAWGWKVLLLRQYRGDEKPFLHYIGGFTHPFDAFAFAELKAKECRAAGEKESSVHVCLWAYAENSCTPEIARLSWHHLTDLRRAKRLRQQREDRRRHLAAA